MILIDTECGAFQLGAAAALHWRNSIAYDYLHRLRTYDVSTVNGAAATGLERSSAKQYFQAGCIPGPTVSESNYLQGVFPYEKWEK